MRGKDKYLKNISIVIITIVILSKNLLAENIKLRLLDYNNGLKNSSMSFIQTDNKTIEEGNVFIGNDRIKVEYNSPKKITIVISEKKGMYVNHKLEETQFFNTNKSFIKFFFKMFKEKNFFNDLTVREFEHNIVVNDKIIIEDILYSIEIIYENNPIKLRKIKIKQNNERTEMGFLDHEEMGSLDKSFFALINPYPG